MSVSIISARRGEGKTTFLRAYAARAATEGRSVGGIASPAVFEGDRRIGYDLLDLGRNHSCSLARVVTAENGVPTVGRYRFDDTAVATGSAAILAAVHDGLDVIAVDEVGPLEFRGQGWAPALETALRELNADQELVVVVRASLADELSARFPSPLWETARRIWPPWPASVLT